MSVVFCWVFVVVVVVVVVLVFWHSLARSPRTRVGLICWLVIGDERERMSLLPDIIRSSCPHLG